jgi:hypothetical protein
VLREVRDIDGTPPLTEEGFDFEARPVAWWLAVAVVTGIWNETATAGLTGSRTLIVMRYPVAKDGAATRAQEDGSHRWSA